MTSKRTERAITAMLPTDDGKGKTRRTIGREAGSVEVWIDVDLLLRIYGQRALGSKGRKARIAQGAVILKAVDVRAVSP